MAEQSLAAFERGRAQAVSGAGSTQRAVPCELYLVDWRAALPGRAATINLPKGGARATGRALFVSRRVRGPVQPDAGRDFLTSVTQCGYVMRPEFACYKGNMSQLFDARRDGLKATSRLGPV